MLWHIFKKDVRLLWPFGVAAAALQFAIVAVHLRLGVFQDQPLFSSVLLLLESMMYFGVAVLIATVIHEDSVVGVRQDWLVRPIRRRDLFAAKLLFVLLAVQVPMLIADLVGGVANEFPVWLSSSEALSQNAYFFVGFTLPIFAFISVTRSTSEALGFAFLIVVGNILGAEALILPLSGSPLGPTSNTGLTWIPQTWRFAIFLVAAVAILALQYLRRSSGRSRLILACAVVVCLLTQLVPWRVVFAWQEAIAPAPRAAQVIAVRFNSDVHAVRPEAMARSSVVPATFAPLRNHEQHEDAVLHIPLVFNGIPKGSILKIDRAVARLAASNATRRRTITAMTDPGSFEVPENRPLEAEAREVSEVLHVRGKSYARLKDKAVAIELDYSATLLNPAFTSTVPAVNGDVLIHGLGHCETRLNDSRTEVELRCLNIGNTSQCTTALLEDPSTGLHNPPLHGCRDDYAPYFGRYKPPDTITHTGFNFDFRDASGLISYPVNESMVNGAQVIVNNYNVAGHFTMHLMIPSIRLADWSGPAFH